MRSQTQLLAMLAVLTTADSSICEVIEFLSQPASLADESKVALLPFLNACFALVEVEDDLRDYAEDLDRNTFNVYRAFVRRYDDAAPSKLLSWIVTLEATYLQLRTCLSEADLRSHLERNEQQGGAGPAMAPSSGRWVIPPPRREAPALEQAPGEAPPGE